MTKFSIGEGVALLTLLIAICTGLCSAFGVGYVFALNPRFLSGLSLTDLVFLFGSSTSSLIFVLLTLVPSIKFLIFSIRMRGLMKRLKEGEGSSVETRNESGEPTRRIDPSIVVSIFSTTTVTVSVSFISLYDLLSGQPYYYSPFNEFMVVGGICVLAISFAGSAALLIPKLVTVFVYLAAAFYTFGDVTARRDMAWAPVAREMPCAFLDQSPRCYHLLLLGSEVAIVQHDRRVAMVPRTRIRTVQVLAAPTW